MGQGHELSVELPSHELIGEDLHQLRQAFETLYQKIYGLIMPDAEIEFVSWSVTVGTKPVSSPLASTPSAITLRTTKHMRSVYDAGSGKLIQHAVFERSQLHAGDSLHGPAVIVEEETTTIVPPKYTLIVDSGGALILSSKVWRDKESSGADI